MLFAKKNICGGRGRPTLCAEGFHARALHATLAATRLGCPSRAGEGVSCSVSTASGGQMQADRGVRAPREPRGPGRAPVEDAETYGEEHGEQGHISTTK